MPDQNHPMLYTPEQKLRRDASVWTLVQGILAPVQFIIFLVSLGLVLRCLMTGEGEEIALWSVVVKTIALYTIMVTGSLWEKDVFGKYLFAPAFFWEDAVSFVVITLHTAYLGCLLSGAIGQTALLLLALAAFAYFEFQGFRANGLGYLKKFFPVYEFKSGIGAGLIAMFVGLIELLLEFIKPVTLAMRLFGNIYGGEVALGVMTALVVAVVPVALYFLEAILTFAQALIFSVLTLMFTLIAVESHDHDEGEMGHEAMDAVHDSTQAAPAAA